MAKYLRKKSDGHVYDFNMELAKRNDMEEFESDAPPPERIENLVEFLTGSAKEKATRKKAAE